MIWVDWSANKLVSLPCFGCYRKTHPEQALLVSRGAAELWMKALLDSTAGIIFLGTPHTGSNLADWASILTKFSSIVRPTNKNILGVLQPGSEMLADLQQDTPQY